MLVSLLDLLTHQSSPIVSNIWISIVDFANDIFVYLSTDIDECQDGFNGGCQKYCNNTIGSYHCYCDPGFKVVNGKQCEGNVFLDI